MRALLLQVLYSIRSERLLMEQLDYNLLFRWFVGMNIEEAVWDATTFSKNRERLMKGEIAQAFFQKVVEGASRQGLLSDEHFSVDGTLLEAWASMRSYQKKEDPPAEGSGSRGRVLRRDTHESKTDPDACLYRKSNGGEFKLCYLGHILMENRHGLPVGVRVTSATPQGEWEAALDMITEVKTENQRVTLGADRAYDEAKLIAELREQKVTPHIHQHQSESRRSNLDGRTTRHPGYEISLKSRKRIERIFGWLKTTGVMRKVRHRGLAVVQWMFTVAVSAYNLLRLSRLTLPAV
jgi:IS5 family transposase